MLDDVGQTLVGQTNLVALIVSYELWHFDALSIEGNGASTRASVEEAVLSSVPVVAIFFVKEERYSQVWKERSLRGGIGN